MKRHVLAALCLAALLAPPAAAQRIQQPLGRGVVAVQNGSNVLVTWRRLAQEPEDAAYNVYVARSGSAFVKVNDEPVDRTNFATTTSTIPVGSQVAVSVVTKDGKETRSEAFTFRAGDFADIFFDIDFHDSPLPIADYTTKYVWPVDLDGDGEYDFVVDRLHAKDGLTDKVEGYLRTGEHLWTVDMGPNEFICMGQDDQVLAYDMDCDGRGDVVMQTSDGTRFWDAQKGDWGEYLLGKEDTDDDGIVEYEKQGSRNAPRYMTVVDGMTGKELATVEQIYTPYYDRDNRASLMGDEYNKHVGHMGVFYHDGIHPAVVMEYHTRTVDGAHHYYNGAWAFDFSGGTAHGWHQLFNEPTGGATFHQIRVADPDEDGRDEMVEGGYTMDHTGKTLFNAGISHGDRFRTGDIDPERPGLETFAIQQDAPDMLGQILYDAATGEAIKKWYLSAVGDVGRGECLDLDSRHFGYEMFSTMEGMYDAKGELIADLPTYFPTEGIWWDGELDRERLDSPDGDGYNIDIRKYNRGANTRLVEIAKKSGYKYLGQGKKLGLFMGDIIGDWREEVILRKQEAEGCTGITGFSTDISAGANGIYCLQEDPAYRMQCTTKGYYQSPLAGFYLGYDMPRPQLPPCMVADLVCRSSGDYTDFARKSSATYEDGKSVLFDLETAEDISVDRTLRPGTIYAMPVKGQTVRLGGGGKIEGSADLWKSQAGTLELDIPWTGTGTLYVSQGTLEVNGEVSGKIELRARGTLSGSGSVGDIAFEGALHREGGRIAPSPCLTFRKGLDINRKTFIEMDLYPQDGQQTADLVKVEGDFSVSAPLTFTFVTHGDAPQPGRYKLVEHTGRFTGDVALMSAGGLQGLSYSLVDEEQALWLVVNEQREAATGVKWSGAVDGTWDYATENFILGGQATAFVGGDEVAFTDEADVTTVRVNELMPTAGVTVDNSAKDYTFNGNGGLSGTGGLLKLGEGKLVLAAKKSDYTGPTVISGGTVRVAELSDGGNPSSIGASSADAANLRIGRATLIVDNTNTATDRGITLTDSAVISVASGATSLKGIVTGAGTLVKEGAGQLNLTYAGQNTYSGGTVLRGGTLAMGAWNTTFGAAASKITAYGGTIRIFDNNMTSAVPSFGNTLEVTKGSTVTLVGGQRCSIQGRLTGEGTLKVSFPYVRGDVSTDMSGFSGTLDVTSGQFRLTRETDLRQAAVVLESNAYLAHFKAGSGTETNLTTRMGSLASASTDCSLGTGTYEIGYDGTSTTYAGSFAASARVSKVGEGTWTLSGTSSTGVSVEGGTLALAGSATMEGLATVEDGAFLDIAGTLRNARIQTGGTLCVSRNRRTCSEGHVSGNLTLAKEGIVEIKTANARNDKFRVDGSVTLASPVIKVEQLRGEYEAGDAFPIFTGFSSLRVTGTPSVMPAVPGEGLAWDLSTFATDATLRVVEASGVGGISAARYGLSPNPASDRCLVTFDPSLPAPTEVRIYDLQGKTLLRERVAPGATSQVLRLGFADKGTYLVVVVHGSALMSYKLVKK